MCGIVGVLGYGKGGISQWAYGIFLNMLYADSLRGMHGTGMLAVSDEGEFNWTKVGGPPSQLFKSKDFEEMEKFFGRKHITGLIGHNRYATKGARNTANAHPFRDQHIILVHNGTLKNYYHFPGSEKYEVDSEFLTHLIAEKGIDEAIKGLEGAWSLAYYDTKDRTFNILLNGERPLFRAWHETEEMWVFASEGEMLDWCMKRNMYQEFKVEPVPVNTLFSFGLNDPKPKSRPLFGKPAEVAKVSYFEGFAPGDTSGLCDTDCGTVSGKEVRPPYKSKGTVSQGEWGRGKTGQAQVLQLAAPHKGTKKDGTPAKLWVPATSLHNIGVGDIITTQIVNYDLLVDSTDQYVFEGTHEDYPDVEFRAYIRGEKAAETLMDNAVIGIKGRVFQIQKSTVPSAVNAHRVILHDPEPVFEVPLPAISPETSYTEH